MIDKTALQIATSIVNANEQSALSLITGVRYNASLVRKFNNMTFLYDPNWEYEQGNPTYPIAFFYVKAMSEQMSSDISAKPMLFYNAGTEGKDATAGGLMNIVADNVIIRPKEYKLEIVIPANGSVINEQFLNFRGHTDISSFIFTGSERSVDWLGNLAWTAELTMSSVSMLLKSLYGAELNAESVFQSLMQQQDYNKASIEHMWRSRRILRLKLWNGWKFKYLAIKDLDVSKSGEDGDYFTASLVCQELPIITFRRREQSALTQLDEWSSDLGGYQKAVVNKFIKVMTASYGAK